jgi:hypothetical protein
MMRLIRELSIAVVLVMVVVAPCCSAPLIHWVSDPVAPGETVLIVGEHLNDVTSTRIRRLPDNSHSARDTLVVNSQSVALRRVSATSFAFTLPNDLTAGVYKMVVTTREGTTTRLINAPIVYWVQGDKGKAATVGGWVRVFGRNIARTDRAVLRFSRGGKLVSEVKVAAVDLWDGHFKVPADLPTDHYDLTLWNGNGNAETTAVLGVIDVLPAPSKAIAHEIKLITAISGNSDDTQRIQEALTAMGKAGGGILRLSRGIFTVSDTLEVPPQVSLQGAGMDFTTIVLADQPKPPDAVISGRSSFSVGNLAITAAMHGHIIRGGFEGDKPIPSARDIAIDHVRIRASIYSGHLTPEDIKQRLIFALRFSSGGPDAVRLSGERISLTNSDILSSGRSLFLNSVHNGNIANNKLFNGRYGWYSISVSSEVIFENNTVTGADLQSTGGGINTMYGSGDFAAQNILIRGNRFIRTFGWDREAMTSDGPGGCYAGPMRFELGQRTAFTTSRRETTQLDACTGGAMMVLNGAGRGTIRALQSCDSTRVTMDEPMPIASDGASFAVIGALQRNYIIIGNTFEDAGVLQFFGTSVDHVIADNTFIRSDGIYLHALRYGELQPILFIQILNNRILSAPPGRAGLIQIRTVPPDNLTVPLIIGVVVRGNDLMSNSRIEVRGTNNYRSGIADVLIENNQIAHADDGISLDGSAQQALVIGNTFEDVPVPVVDHSQP